jgi:predicted secreted Zn-dependent protease
VVEENFATALWRKSSNSGDGDCVEVALRTRLIGVRDTKDRGAGPVLAFKRDAWASFVGGVRAGDFGMVEENRT